MKNLQFKVETVAVAGVAAFAFLVVGFFAGRFWGQPLALDSSRWGEFGDYIGGVLNPVVALAALLLLARSIGMQRDELKETRKVLDEQASSAKLSANLSALAAAISSHQSQVEMLENQLQFYADQLSKIRNFMPVYDFSGEQLQKTEVKAHMVSLCDELDTHKRFSDFYRRRLRVILGEQGLGQHYSEDEQWLDSTETFNSEQQFFTPEVSQPPSERTDPP